MLSTTRVLIRRWKRPRNRKHRTVLAFDFFLRPSLFQPTMIRTLLISIPLVRVYSTLTWERIPSNSTLYFRLYRLTPICVYLHRRDCQHQELLRSLSRLSRHFISYPIAVNSMTSVTFHGIDDLSTNCTITTVAVSTICCVRRQWSFHICAVHSLRSTGLRSRLPPSTCVRQFACRLFFRSSL